MLGSASDAEGYFFNWPEFNWPKRRNSMSVPMSAFGGGMFRAGLIRHRWPDPIMCDRSSQSLVGQRNWRGHGWADL